MEDSKTPGWLVGIIIAILLFGASKTADWLQAKDYESRYWQEKYQQSQSEYRAYERGVNDVNK